MKYDSGRSGWVEVQAGDRSDVHRHHVRHHRRHHRLLLPINQPTHPPTDRLTNRSTDRPNDGQTDAAASKLWASLGYTRVLGAGPSGWYQVSMKQEARVWCGMRACMHAHVMACD